MSTTPLTDAINALTRYANDTTGASDTTLSEAVATLAAGYGGGGGGGSSSYVPNPNKPLTSAIESLTAYANSVTGASDQTLSEAVATLIAGYGGSYDWTDYVQNGLEIIWDGIQNTRNGHASSPSAWENLAGSSFDMANRNVTFEDDCAVFTGANYFKTTYTAKSYMTAEIVVSHDTIASSDGICAKTNTSRTNESGIGLITYNKNTNKYRFYTGHGLNQYRYKPVAADAVGVKNSFSAVADTNYNCDLYKNGVLTSETYASEDWGYGDYSIGAYDRNTPPNNYFFKGKIYCIRLYTRQLTESEVLQNYAVDKARFNLE